MTALGVVAILVGLLGWKIALLRPTRLTIAVFAAVFVLHVVASVAFYLYAQSAVTDSFGYYFDPLGFADFGFGLSTQLIYFIVHGLRAVIGGTFLDYFLLFQLTGLFGLCLLMRTFDEIYAELGSEPPPYVYLFLFIPGMHFWTAAIGKDGFLFLGVCLALWSSLNLRGRFLWLAVAILIMLAIRPHIALITAAAYSGALLMDRTLRTQWRILLMLAAIAGLGVAVLTIQSTFRLDVTDAESVSDYLAGFEQVTSDTAVAGTTAVYGSYPVRLLSLLFRPLFLDASGAMGLVASMENLVMIFIVGTMLFRIRDLMATARAVTFIRFALLLAIGIALMLTLIYYNVGLGLRQRTMFVPALLIVFVALAAVRRARAALEVRHWEARPASR